MLARVFAALMLLASPVHAAGLSLSKAPGAVRVATFNTDMNRKGAGVLIADIAKGDPQISAVVEIILRVRPDIILLNEIDHDPEGIAVDAFRALLAKGLDEHPGLDFEHRHIGPMNTGVPVGVDLDGDGKVMGARDAKGFGRFPGQYGMALLSRFPLGTVRAFQDMPWSAAPWAENPKNPDGSNYFSEEAWARLPLSSKSHWDVVAVLPGGPLHLLASHPTPPVFDGPEDRNGLRNAAEIRFWTDYISGANWMVDAMGQAGGLSSDAAFVVLGDLNADPEKGDGIREAIGALLRHPRVNDPGQISPGAAALGAAMDTADWPEKNGPGNLRVDYALPSVNLEVTGSGVFWPTEDDPLHRLVAIKGRKRASSDHRLVWVDIVLEPQ